MKKSFTLIELLIVIGILAILVVTILITSNPSEAQKKARDAKRMKDLSVLQAIAVQWLNDGNQPINSTSCLSNEMSAGHTLCNSLSAGNVSSQPCNSNGLGTNICQYTNSVPTDPRNNTPATYVCGGTVQTPIICTGSSSIFRYLFNMEGGNFKIGVMQESKADANNTLNDGGTNPSYAEVFSGPDGLNLW